MDESPEKVLNPRNHRDSNLIPQDMNDVELQPLHLMSEDEVRGIVADFNKNMNEVLIENEDLKTKIQEFYKERREAEEKIETLAQGNKILTEEKGHYQALCSQYFEKLKLKEQEFINEGLNKVNDLKDDSTIDQIHRYHEIIETNVHDHGLKEGLSTLLSDYEKTKQDMIQLSKKFEYLAKENEELKSAVNKNNDDNILKDCMRCREKFSPLLNNDQACTYHTGKLKYYSCRGCGADEYWACCNKCTNCLKGCRTGKHITAV